MSSGRPRAIDSLPLPPGHNLLAHLGGEARISTARPAEGVAVFAIAGEIQYKNSPQLQHELRYATEDQPARVVVNLQDVLSMDSSGVATLLDALTRVRRYGGQFRLAAVREQDSPLKKFSGELPLEDAPPLTFNAQTLYRLRKRGRSWKIVGFIGYLPMSLSAM